MIRALCNDDWAWSWKFRDAQEYYTGNEVRARELLRATKEADEILVSIEDLDTLDTLS